MHRGFYNESAVHQFVHANYGERCIPNGSAAAWGDGAPAFLPDGFSVSRSRPESVRLRDP